jgi:hypothetical protein
MRSGAVAATRPPGITALAIFFGLGAIISMMACVSLLAPGSALEPMWRLNPRARQAFQRVDPAGPLLLGVVSAACASAAGGLWGGKPWGYRVAVALLVVNLLGDIANVLLGVEPRAIVGVPIVAALLVFLASARVRSYFQDRKQ